MQEQIVLIIYSTLELVVIRLIPICSFQNQQLDDWHTNLVI